MIHEPETALKIILIFKSTRLPSSRQSILLTSQQKMKKNIIFQSTSKLMKKFPVNLFCFLEYM